MSRISLHKTTQGLGADQGFLSGGEKEIGNTVLSSYTERVTKKQTVVLLTQNDRARNIGHPVLIS